MIWASAQAGNRAGKTGCQQQWWDKGSEWKAVAPAVWKLLHYTPIAFFLAFIDTHILHFCSGHNLACMLLLGIVMFS